MVSYCFNTQNSINCHPGESGDPENRRSQFFTRSIFSAHKEMAHLYIGVTNDLPHRVFEHKNELAEGFTKKYGVDKLVYVESYQDVREAIHREKCLKKWNRRWKVRLIEKENPDWKDLYESIL